MFRSSRSRTSSTSTWSFSTWERVGYPDFGAFLGERCCAFVVLRPGQTLDLSSLQSFMTDHKVAKQYWPERLEIVADLPTTPAGKIQKYQLRERAKAFGDISQKASA